MNYEWWKQNKKPGSLDDFIVEDRVEDMINSIEIESERLSKLAEEYRKKLNLSRWKPEQGEEYWSYNPKDGTAQSAKWDNNNPACQVLRDIGNVFPTEGLAIGRFKQLKERMKE